MKFFIKLFIRDYQNIQNDKVRNQYGVFVSWVGILANILIFFIKFILGLFCNSIAIITDSINNLSDSASSIISLIGFKLSNKQPDKEHPFGHGRIEYIASFIISIIIIIIGFEFFKSSIYKILKPDNMNFNYTIIIILLITIFIKFCLTIFYKKMGNLINSNSILAAAVDSRNDILITLITVLSLFIFKFLNINLDGYFGTIVSLILIYSGISLSKEMLSPLIGERIDKELEDKIKQIVLSYDEIIGQHELLVHNYGPNKNIATIHLEVPANIPIKHSHEIIDNIEREVFNKLGVFLTIHIDPVDLEDNRIQIIKNAVQNILKNKDNIKVYDFRIINREILDEIVFDLKVPYNLRQDEIDTIILKIKQGIYDLDFKYQVNINVTNYFI